MTTTNFVDTLTATAVSFTVAGNTGVSPFLTLFVVGLCEASNSSLLDMNDTMEAWLASWPALLLWGSLSIFEFIGKCIPVVDELIDSVMTFVIPFVSVLGSLSTMGLLDDSFGDGGNLSQYVNDDNDDDPQQQRRQLLNVISSVLWILKLSIVLVGIGLALGMHLLKVIVRLVGEGWLTNVLTIVEVTFVIVSLTFAIYMKPIAILVAIGIVMAAGVSLKRKYINQEDPAMTAEEWRMTTGPDTVSSSTLASPSMMTSSVVASPTMTTAVGNGNESLMDHHMEQGGTKDAATSPTTTSATNYVKM